MTISKSLKRPPSPSLDSPVLKKYKEDSAFPDFFDIPDILGKIFSNLRCRNIMSCASVSKQWDACTNAWKSNFVSQSVFGKMQWEKYWGKIDDSPLPNNMFFILMQKSPLGHKWIEDFNLYFFPEAVDQVKLTIEHMEVLAKNPKNKGFKYQFMNSSILSERGRFGYWQGTGNELLKKLKVYPINSPGWFFITKTGKACALTEKQQFEFLENLQTKSGLPFRFPQVEESVMSTFMDVERYDKTSRTYSTCFLKEQRQVRVGCDSLFKEVFIDYPLISCKFPLSREKVIDGNLNFVIPLNEVVKKYSDN